MITVTVIAYGTGWNLHEETANETTWVYIGRPDFLADQNGIKIRLPNGLIDALREAKPECIPHLRKKGAQGYKGDQGCQET